MRVKQLWVVAVGFSLLLSAPAWAHSKRGESAGEKQKNEREDSSIRLKTKHAEPSVLSQRLGAEHPGLSKALAKRDRYGEKAGKSGKSQSHVFVGGLPPGLQKKLVLGGLPPGLEQQVVLGGLPPGLEKQVGEIRLQAAVPSVDAAVQTQIAVQAEIPIPEPSAALLLGVGLIVVRRAIGRTWR